MPKLLAPFFVIAATLVLLSACQSHIANVSDDISFENLSVNEEIRVNQVGYVPGYSKLATVVNSKATRFQLINSKNEPVYSGKLIRKGTWEFSGEDQLKVADFSEFDQKGEDYRLFIEDKGLSYPFDIGNEIYRDPLLASAKSYYMQRASFELESEFAGIYERPLSHPDTKVYFHPSTGRSGITSSPGGWYDAGDFNKYIINGAIATSQMMSVVELFPSILKDGSLNIPESGNGINDLLDEIRYELDWMLTMQDTDGGVFHKLTNKKFEATVILAEDAKMDRYIVGKGTTATLDFAAAMAHAARLYKSIDATYSKKTLAAAKAAWAWAQKHPAVEFKNPEDVHTGEYGDDDFNGELFWAAAELYTTTGEREYLNEALKRRPKLDMRIGESWRLYLSNLGMYSMLQHAKQLPRQVYDELYAELISLSDRVLSEMQQNAYSTNVDSWEWGSNSDVLNSMKILAHAYHLTKDKKYLNGMIKGTDYVFGRNATGYSYVTGIGDKTPMNPHHRQSAADNIEQPVPGLIVGGANGFQQDKTYVDYTFDAPAKSYEDVVESYAANEVCLNWNAPLVFVLAFIDKHI